MTCGRYRADGLVRIVAAALVGCGAILVIPACSPFNINISLGRQDREISATEVLADEGAEEDSTIALIDLRGVIADARSPSLLGEGANPVDAFLARLHRAERDEDVRAVVVRINSPGGTVTGSHVIYEELRGFRERTGKPVVASLGEVAASGGYYVALAGDEIVASPMGITGSIGVIIPTINVAEGLSRIGVVSRAITSGPNKDLANPLEPMEEEEYAILQGMVDEMYARFRSLVLERRAEADPERADEFADGRVFTGAEAARLGLADSIGGLRDAFERAKGLAGLERGRLVKLHGEGQLVRTAYARTAPAGPRAGDVNLLKLEAGGLLDPHAPRAYFIWPAALR